ncbi:MAG: HEPN domain-containing protein [archaeon]
MRREIRNWWLQAKHDLSAAEKNLNCEEFYLVAFLAHQSVEKGLKAAIMKKFGEISQTHSLIELGKKLKVSETILKSLRMMSPDYIISRYPDATDSVPYENYDKESALDRLENAKRVFEWLQLQMKE